MIQLTDKVFAIEVPEGMEAFDIECLPEVDLYELKCYEFGEYDMPVKEKSIDLPPGNWRYICTSKEITLSDAAKIVQGELDGWKDYAEGTKLPLPNPIASLNSLLASKGLEPDRKNYALIENIT